MAGTIRSLPFFCRKDYMNNRIRIYEIKSEYIQYLSNNQKHIFAQADVKNMRKYIGVVFEIKSIKYFAPLY